MKLLLPCGRTVTIERKNAHLDFAVDTSMAGKPEVYEKWAWAESLARRIREIDGKPVTGYNLTRLTTDFDDGDLKILVIVTAAADNPTPEQLAAAYEGTGLASHEALAECLTLHRVSGGAIDFRTAMEMDQARRKTLLAMIVGESVRREAAGSQRPKGHKGPKGQGRGQG